MWPRQPTRSSRTPRKAIRVLGKVVQEVAQHAGGIALLAWHVARATPVGRVRWRDVIADVHAIGVGSVPLALCTASPELTPVRGRPRRGGSAGKGECPAPGSFGTPGLAGAPERLFDGGRGSGSDEPD